MDKFEVSLIILYDVVLENPTPISTPSFTTTFISLPVLPLGMQTSIPFVSSIPYSLFVPSTEGERAWDRRAPVRNFALICYVILLLLEV